MAVNYTDFEKIWASASPLTPYSFTDANYKRGWDFVGSTPPSRQMWDAFMQNADEKLQYLYLHEDVPVGHEYFTFNPNVPQGSLPLFGGEYSRETYSALWSWVQEQTGYLKTESEWQALATANNGNVPYYSDGDGSTTFRVPALKCYIKAADGTVNEVGSYYAAGLPNITGSFGLRKFASGSPSVYYFSGAIYKGSDIVDGSNTLSSSGATYNLDNISINASRSSSIYGNSTTVTPETVVGMWLVKAYGVIQDTGTINEQQYIDDRIAAEVTRADGKYLPLAGGTMTGDITLPNGTAIAEDDIFYKAGDTEDFDTFCANGNITSSAKEMRFSVFTPKRLDKINSVTITLLSGGIRVPAGGYIDTDGTNLLTKYNCGAWKSGKNLINISLGSGSAISGATNNTPISFWVHVTFSFS